LFATSTWSHDSILKPCFEICKRRKKERVIKLIIHNISFKVQIYGPNIKHLYNNPVTMACPCCRSREQHLVINVIFKEKPAKIKIKGR
jgi:hypothetical protein